MEPGNVRNDERQSHRVAIDLTDRGEYVGTDASITILRESRIGPLRWIIYDGSCGLAAKVRLLLRSGLFVTLGISRVVTTSWKRLLISTEPSTPAVILRYDCRGG
jgi:hypothetical protein